ncbi:MAG TPA: sigma-70 family RNA polymerase sigma factor [Thermomicrobiales bacterium]|nr:sigma-70 family RNA polymerase sigma factor [Thermomicrobiales bacterium]
MLRFSRLASNAPEKQNQDALERRHDASASAPPRPADPGTDAGIPDEQLVLAAQAGNMSAFNELVTRHERAVFNVGYRLLSDASLAEDAAQDTFIRAWGAIDTFRGGVVRPWLLRIATNRAYDLLRAKSRRPATSLDAELFEVEPHWTSQLVPAEGPETHAARIELSVFLERALATLSDDQRLAVILSDVQGYGYDEIAEICGVAVGTVKSRISRGRARMRDLLASSDQHRELFERFARITDEDS